MGKSHRLWIWTRKYPAFTRYQGSRHALRHHQTGKSEVKDCKTPYIYHSYIVFSKALTSPLLTNITLSDKDTPQLVSVGV
jgi:hypothetical protein